MSSAPEPLRDIKYLSDLTGIPVKTLRNWRHLGKGPRAIRMGGLLRWRDSDIEAWIESQAEEWPIGGRQ